jgi:hypothetical protein
MGADVRHPWPYWLLEALMRPHGRAQISAKAPRATAICQRCGFMYNLDQLQWQWDWQQGPRLFNLRIQVCRTCLDVPQESGRTIVLPPDPMPVKYPLPENYALADNPLSPLGYSPANNFLPNPPNVSGSIGTLTLNAGVDAAFNGTYTKSAEMSAARSVSDSSFGNWVGKNWNAQPSGIALTITSTVAVLTHVISSFALYAPSDQSFLRSGTTTYHIDGSADGANWTTLVSGFTAGTAGEIITGASTAGAFYQYHRAAFLGNGISAVAVAQAVFNVSDAAPNDI